MKFTLSWLKQHLDTDASLEEIGRTLTMIGLEVESIHNPGAELTDFIVGHVKSADKHPDADKLKLCQVDTGAEILQVVCGAPNARAGLKVVLARPGTRIPDSGQVLKKGKIRGVESQGMMCSSRELNLGDDHAGIIELPESAPVGESVVHVLSMDPVIDIAVTPNRPDCLGVRGVARDLAAAGLGTLKPDPQAEPFAGSFKSPVAIRRRFPDGAGDACPLYVGRYFRGIRNGPSPRWAQDLLRAIGLRPISAVVDITNLVCIGYGRPLHAFDAAKLSGDVVVRFAEDGEEILALNGKTYALDQTMVAICDEQRAHAIGGIIGGEESGCTETTTDVFLEAALFDPRRVAATGRRLGIDSDARHRLERGVDPMSTLWGMEVATRLILEFCGGEASELEIAGAVPDWSRTIALRPARVAQVVGVAVDAPRITAMLEGLGCVVGNQDGTLLVAPPSWRADLEAEHDLVEEVARLNGYDNIPAVPLPRAGLPVPVLTARQRQTRAITRALAARGLLETVTWSFLGAPQAALFAAGGPAVRLANPISSDLDVMRPSIVPNLALAAGRNAARGFPDLGLFEIGPQFRGGEPGDQDLMATVLRAGATGPRHWNVPPRPVDAFDAKADALAVLKAAGMAVDSVQVSTTDAPAWYHPGRSGVLRLGPQVLAVFGELHPGTLRALDVKGPMVACEVFLERLPLPKVRPTRARPLLRASAFQPLERDFAFVVDSAVAADALVRAARGADRALVADVGVFDLYEGPNMPEGRKSVAIRVVLQPQDRTLTEEDLDLVSRRIVAAIEKATGGTLRG